MSDENGEAPRGNPKTSDYTVMYCLGSFETPEEALAEGSWVACGQYTVANNNGQRDARKQALESTVELLDRVNAGEPVWFLCLPLRSTHPFRVEMQAREPQLLI